MTDLDSLRRAAIIGLALAVAVGAAARASPASGPRRPSCAGIVKNHPLPDGNERCAFLATVEFVERNGRRWLPAPGDPDETDQVIRAAAGGELGEADFRDWIAARCG